MIELELIFILDILILCFLWFIIVELIIKVGEGNNLKLDDEFKIIIGVCVFVFGLILLLVVVGIVIKIYKEKYKNVFILYEFLKKDKNYF